MFGDIPGLDMFFTAIDMSYWGAVIGGQVGYVIGFVLNLAVMGLLVWKFVLQKYIIYRFDVEVTMKRGNNVVIKWDRGRIIKLKDGTEGFKLLKNKIILDPIDFKFVLNTKKPFSFGLIRLFQFSPRSFAFLKDKNVFAYVNNEIVKDDNYKKLTVLEQDKNRAIDMALKTEKKLNPPNAFTTYILPLVGMGFIITVLVLLFLMADKGIELGGTFSSAADNLKQAIVSLNKCQVSGVVTG